MGIRKGILITSLLLVIGMSIALAQPNNPGHDSLYILRAGDTIAGIFNFTERVVVPEPSSPSDAATRAYVDSQVGGVGDVGGSGTQNYIPRWSETTELTDSLIFQNGSNIGIGTTDPNATFVVIGSGLFTGTVTVPEPTAPNHAATRDFVLTQVAQSGDGSVTEISAGTGIIASPNPITETGTISLDESYTDDRYIEVSGDTMEGVLNMDGNRITNVGPPLAGNDSATRDYVLAQVSASQEGATQTLEEVLQEGDNAGGLNIQNVQNLDAQIIEGHNSDYGIYKNSTHTIIGYIGGLT